MYYKTKTLHFPPIIIHCFKHARKIMLFVQIFLVSINYHVELNKVNKDKADHIVRLETLHRK